MRLAEIGCYSEMEREALRLLTERGDDVWVTGIMASEIGDAASELNQHALEFVIVSASLSNARRLATGLARAGWEVILLASNTHPISYDRLSYETPYYYALCDRPEMAAARIQRIIDLTDEHWEEWLAAGRALRLQIDQLTNRLDEAKPEHRESIAAALEEAKRKADHFAGLLGRVEARQKRCEAKYLLGGYRR